MPRSPNSPTHRPCVLHRPRSARLATIDLTSVSQATEPMAVEAVQAATQRLDEGRDKAVDIVLEPHLEVRSTTGAAPAT